MSTTTAATPHAERGVRSLRRVIVAVTIGSFSLAALLGVVALLSGGAFGETESRVLLTTVVVGLTSVAVLCYLATGGTRFWPVGVLGGVVVLVPFVTALVLVWSGWQQVTPEWVGRTLGIGSAWAATLAQVSLLLGLSATRRVRPWLLWPTVALAGLLGCLITYLMLGSGDPSPGVLRTLGVTAILDVLGTVVGVALAAFGGRSPRGAPDGLAIVLPPGVSARVEEEARRSGRSPTDVVADLLRAGLDTGDRTRLEPDEPLRSGA